MPFFGHTWKDYEIPRAERLRLEALEMLGSAKASLEMALKVLEEARRIDREVTALMDGSELERIEKRLLEFREDAEKWRSLMFWSETILEVEKRHGKDRTGKGSPAAQGASGEGGPAPPHQGQPTPRDGAPEAPDQRDGG